MTIEHILFWGSALVLISILASKLSHKFAVPSLLLFLLIGMLAGSEGPGGIAFDDPVLAKTIGIIALIGITFSGGLNTSWRDTRSVLAQGLVLSTAGVLGTAVIVGAFAASVLKFTFLEGMLVGAIISSTDAAAVFSILKSKRISLKRPLRPLLEFESGSNDPMAVFLTLGIIYLLTHRGTNPWSLVPLFVLNMSVGALIGFVMASLTVNAVNRLKLEHSDLYPIATLSLTFMAYALSAYLKGNGFLTVYVVGLIMSSRDFVHKKVIIRFHETVAWMMQIVMFLALGLLVVPSQIVPLIGPGLFLALVLIVVARPVSVFLILAPFKMALRYQAMISWVGLRGAAPIILATFPLLAKIDKANDIFNLIFFVVLSSVLIQGTSIPLVSKLLKVSAPWNKRRERVLEMNETEGMDAELLDIIVPYDSCLVGKHLYELHFPERSLIVLITRDDKFIIPSGATVLEGGDVLQLLANKEDLAKCTSAICNLRYKQNDP